MSERFQLEKKLDINYFIWGFGLPAQGTKILKIFDGWIVVTGCPKYFDICKQQALRIMFLGPSILYNRCRLSVLF